MQHAMCAASEDSSPSSRLLIEDRRQGCTSAAALSTLAKYAAFVQRTRAPIASMNYSPFTKAKMEAQQQQDKVNVQMHSFDAASINAHFDKLHLDEVLPAASHEDAEAGRPALHELAPGVSHSAPGGEAWTVDVSKLGWIKTSSNPGSKRGSVMSKRGSLIGGASRKSSMNAGDSRLWSTARMENARSRTGGFESSTTVYNMLGIQNGRHYDRGLDLIESSIGSGKEGGWSHGGDKKEGASGSSSRRTSVKLPQQYLRAHQAELKYGLPVLASMQQNKSKSAAQMNKMKRASMPPMHGRRGLLGASSAAASSNDKTLSRRGSLSLSQQQGNPALLSASARARSQSLPTDSLFLAYSQCALPPVMASSLASMPVPSQPAIPVAVARRYSVLLQEKDLAQAASASPNATSEQSMVNVDPAQVSGIDTSSVLDTTALQDLVSPTEALDTIAPCPQPARRGSITSSISAALMHGQASTSASRHSSPASSPIDSNGLAPLPHFSPLATSGATLNMSSLGATRSRSMADSAAAASSSRSSSGLLGAGCHGPSAVLPAASTATPPSSSPTAGLRIQASMVGTDSPAGVSSATASPSLQSSTASPLGAPALSLSSDSLPDFTPMTSPTNLSHASFRSAIMSRRMSDVVARDIGAKLQLLQKQMNQQQQQEEGDRDAIQAMRTL